MTSIVTQQTYNRSASATTQPASAGTLTETAGKLPVATKSTQAVARENLTTHPWKTVQNAERHKPKVHSFSMQNLRVKAEETAEPTLNAYAEKQGKKGWHFHVVTESNKAAGQVVGEVIYTGPTKVPGKEVFDFLKSGVPVELMVPRRGLGKPTMYFMTYNSVREAVPDCKEARKTKNFRVHQHHAGKTLPYNRVVVRVAAGKWKLFFTVWGEIPEELEPYAKVLQVWEESETEKKFRMSAAERREKNRQNQKRRSAWKKVSAGKREAKVEKKSAPKPISVQPAPEKAWVSENLAEEVEKLSVKEFPDLKADC
jgi:hypothetical protein